MDQSNEVEKRDWYTINRQSKFVSIKPHNEINVSGYTVQFELVA